MNAHAPVVEMTNISISFPGVKALDGVNFRMFPGEVHSLLGENGAGKSTLIKALTGVYAIDSGPADSGEILLAGNRVSFAGPAQAQNAGISTVYQEVNLLGNLSVAENIMLGREPRRFGGIDWRATRRRAVELLRGLHLDIDPGSLLGSHSLAVQQLVAIARAIDVNAKVLILDEPTSSLDADEVAELFRVIRELKAEGVAILFVSHFLDQVYEISDRLTVLRNGKLVGEYRTAEILRLDLVQKMIGKELAILDALERRIVEPGGGEDDEVPLLAATALGRKGSIAPVDLRVYTGEVVGLAGLLGSGRTELARILSGIDRPDSGELVIDGTPHRFRTPRSALARGVAYSSENRRAEGIVEDLTVRDNIVLALQADRGWFHPISRKRRDELAVSYIQALNIRPANPDAIVRNLSGGNQQKVLLARWLAVAPRLLILDEPTRGIDVGAKAEIQKLVVNLAENGMSVLFISAELEEVLRLSSRIAIMRDRRLVADIVNDDLTVDSLLAIIADGELTAVER
ncbi:MULTISPECIES: sugar ABC transporter ATP-binding protein [unclassified Cryobacterium]|uniref:sugar ABC transporter ATP-binding protein n=1 Tax=unclassified Cryobacterium TaxID=2649013 RepID=UPI002AB3FBE6|nr:MULTISPECIES: sugar ABC transporter ATP-binding protein [unclassified Cryobacterium]MDY7529264.1 sugar ABC transporter ATP-binding protein [Cryobacterium sp. 10C2]MDY7558574.1 sugar ABC transporter ATP-binding protein [Cryobacterium sp. 10C3]MEB0202997.1 sugar ABC transporter ATP-binding protein [Cryobacterium sp. 5I3]MEB0289743.1 sugar ABC transporter ATP-binding protein [Cryobacterium sp. 10C2]